ncbi:hypothetical protein HANVADRAFT_54001, partial [Hanseniaspora valbyensis NRRL Y-1626]
MSELQKQEHHMKGGPHIKEETNNKDKSTNITESHNDNALTQETKNDKTVPDSTLLTKQEISLDIQHAITGLTNLKNSKRSKLWSQLKNNSDFILSNSHHHLRTIKRKKNIIKEKIKNGSIISGKHIPSQLDINGRQRRVGNNSLQQQLLMKKFEQKQSIHNNNNNNNNNTLNTDNEKLAKLRFMQQKSEFIQGNHKNSNVNSKSRRLKLMTCLKLLKLANRQIKQKIEGLQNKMSEKPNNSNNNSELINTIKKVYMLISKHIGIFLPEPSRLKIRESLLNLPRRVQATEVQSDSIERSTDSKNVGNNSLKEDYSVTKDSKIIILANETLEMIGKVIEILDENLNKAENWVTENQKDLFLDANSEIH